MPRAPWQITVAKRRLSDIINLAIKEGPQIITRRGSETAVVISIDEYRKLSKLSEPGTGLVEFLARSPLAGLELNTVRTDDESQEIEP